jgi:hypothetical protein
VQLGHLALADEPALEDRPPAGALLVEALQNELPTPEPVPEDASGDPVEALLYWLERSLVAAARPPCCFIPAAPSAPIRESHHVPASSHPGRAFEPGQSLGKPNVAATR